MCIVFGRGFPRLSTTCASFLAAAFHGMCIVFGSGFPRLSTTCASFLTAAFHGFPRLVHRFFVSFVDSMVLLQGAALVEAAAKLPLKRGRICIYWDVQLMGTQKQVRSKLEKEIAGGF